MRAREQDPPVFDAVGSVERSCRDSLLAHRCTSRLARLHRVTLTAAAVGGSNFTAGNVVAATNGVASFNVFLNNAANTYQITASAAGLTDGLSSTFNVTATHLAILAIGNVQAGTPFNVTVQGRDADNNVAENFSGNVDVNASATGGSNFNGGQASVAAVGGSATFVGLVLNDAADGYTAHGRLARAHRRGEQRLQRDRRRARRRPPVLHRQPGREHCVGHAVQRPGRGPRLVAGQRGRRRLHRQRHPDRGRGRRLELHGRQRRGGHHGVASFNVFLNNAANTYQITASRRA